MGFHEVRLVEEAVRLVVKDLWSQPFSDRVVHAIADDGRHQQQGSDDFPIDETFASKGSHSKKQGIAGQKRRHDEASLTENNGEKQCVNPHIVVFDKPLEVLFSVQEKINKLAHRAVMLGGLGQGK